MCEEFGWMYDRLKKFGRSLWVDNNDDGLGVGCQAHDVLCSVLKCG